MANAPKGHLPRLETEYYRGDAMVFWTLTTDRRARGWLSPVFHMVFREMMLHAAARQALVCPVYCLMSEHVHLVWLGTQASSDQRKAMRFLREQLRPALGVGREWQHQAHDHVLRDQERDRDNFIEACYYTLANPVRAGLVEREQDWPFSGAVVPGYPTMHPLQADYWDLFWRLYWQKRGTW